MAEPLSTRKQFTLITVCHRLPSPFPSKENSKSVWYASTYYTVQFLTYFYYCQFDLEVKILAIKIAEHFELLQFVSNMAKGRISKRR